MDYRGPDNDTVMVTVEEEGKKTAQQLVGEAVLGALSCNPLEQTEKLLAVCSQHHGTAPAGYQYGKSLVPIPDVDEQIL